jgi:predicted RNA-binding protein YlxR (DUF448 family)
MIQETTEISLDGSVADSVVDSVVDSVSSLPEHPKKGAHQAMRTCLVTGEELPKTALLRFVLSPDGKVVVDIKGNLPGRGMWLKPEHAVLIEACKRNLFAKAAKRRVTVDSTLPDVVERLLRERALAYLTRAQLAGELVTGFEKVLKMVQSGDAGVLIHAADAADDGIRKLKLPQTENLRVVVFCERDIIGAALQRNNPVHLTLKRGGIAKAFLSAFDCWAGFRKQNDV